MNLSSDNLYLFFRQLGEMLGSGIGLVPSLEVLARDEESDLAVLANYLARQVESGLSLSQALRAERGGSFPSTLVVLLEIGESTGRLPQSLLQATTWMRQDRDLVRKVKSSLTYPVFVFAVACGLALMLFTTVIPKLLAVVTGLGARLPWPTKVVSLICTVLTEPAFWLSISSAICFVGAALMAPGATRRAKAALTRLSINLPLLGPTLTTYYFVRFCSGLSVLVESGSSVLEAVSLAQRLSGHPDLIEDQFHFRERVELGSSLSGAMQAREDIYPSLIISFVLMGEESAKLGSALGHVATFLDFALQEKLNGFRQALEPIMTLGVGMLVALVLVATLLPLYSIVASVG